MQTLQGAIFGFSIGFMVSSLLHTEEATAWIQEKIGRWLS